MRGPGSVELHESKLNQRRFGHFCIHMVETRTIVLEDVLRLVSQRSRLCSMKNVILLSAWAELLHNHDYGRSGPSLLIESADSMIITSIKNN